MGTQPHPNVRPRPGSSVESLLTEEQIAEIVSRALPGRTLEHFALETGGLSNLTYRVGVNGRKGRFGLRVYTRDPAACQKEVALHRTLAGQVPVPEIVHVQPDRKGPGSPHVLMQWMEGLTFHELKKSGLPANELNEAAFAVGATLARIGSVALPQPIGLVEAPGSTVARVETWLTSPDLARRLPVGLRERVRAFVAGRAQALTLLDEARSLVHGDFGARNVLLRRDGGRWVVSAVLDWECAFAGSALWDVGHFLRYERRSRPTREPHFSEGFRSAGGVLPNDWRDLTRAVDLVCNVKGLASPELPEPFVGEIVDLVIAAVERRDPP
jgi:fructokinase